MLNKIQAVLMPDNTVTGVTYDGTDIHSVTLKKTGKKVCVKALDMQKTNCVCIAADGPKVRSMIVETPLMKDADLGAWLEDNQSRFFPQMLEFSDFVNDWQVIGRTDESQQVLLGSAWSDRIKALVKEKAPETVGCRGLDLFNPFALWQDGFLQGNKAVVEYNTDLARVLLVQDGRIAFEREIPVEEGAVTDIEYTLIDFWEKEEQQDPVDTVYLCGSGYLNGLRAGFSKVLCRIEDASFEVAGTTIGPAHVHALGLALKQYYPVLNSLNLLPEETKEMNRQKREKKRAVTFGAWHASVFIGLGILLVPLYFWSASVLEASADGIRDKQTEITVMERLVAKNTKMKRNAADLYRLLGKRTNVAAVLDELNGTIEKDMWFKKLEILTGDDGRKTVVLEGYALNSSQISAFLGNLEKTPGIGSARLEMTEKLSAKKVFRLSGRRRRREVFSFTINAELIATEAQRARRTAMQ